MTGAYRGVYLQHVKPREVVALREQLGLNQAQFAAELGVDQSTVSRWENGGSAVRLSMVKLMQRVASDRAPVAAQAS